MALFIGRDTALKGDLGPGPQKDFPAVRATFCGRRRSRSPLMPMTSAGILRRYHESGRSRGYGRRRGNHYIRRDGAEAV